MATPKDIPEPPDGTRIEFTYNGDVYAAWRSDAISEAAGWNSGEVWCLYGDDAHRTWAWMIEQFGAALRHAVRLVPIFEDEEPAGRDCQALSDLETWFRHYPS